LASGRALRYLPGMKEPSSSPGARAPRKPERRQGSRVPAWKKQIPLLDLALLALLVLIAFAPVLGGGFVFDDHSLIENNPSLHSLTGLGRAFTTDFYRFHGGEHGLSAYYRPLASASYVVDYALWDGTPGPYHWLNWIAHGLAVLLAYGLVLRLYGERAMALAVAGLWAVHPVACESVAWISGRTDPLAACFVLGSVLLYLRHRETGSIAALLGSAVCGYLGCLAKEIAVVTPALALLAGRVAFPKERGESAKRLRELGVLSIPVAGYLFQRLAVMGKLSPATYPDGSAVSGLAVFLRATLYYGKVLFFPNGLVGDIHVTPPGLSDPAVVVGAIGVLALCAVAVLGLGKRFALAFPVQWTILTLLPAAGVLAPIPIPVAVRYLYLPSLGVLLGLALLARPWVRRAPLARLVTAMACGLVALALIVLAWRRNREYRDDTAFYTSVIENASRAGFGVEPGYFSLLNFGQQLAVAGRIGEAEALTRRAIVTEPAFPLAWNNLGNILALRGDGAGALVAWQRAIQLDPSATDPQVNRAIALDRLGRAGDAVQAYRGTLALDLPASERASIRARLALLEDSLKAGPRSPRSSDSASSSTRLR
jgi:hypothetical protein